MPIVHLASTAIAQHAAPLGAGCVAYNVLPTGCESGVLAANSTVRTWPDLKAMVACPARCIKHSLVEATQRAVPEP